MVNDTGGITEYGDEIDLRELSILWRASLRSHCNPCTTPDICSVALSLPNNYTSETLLAPRADSGVRGL